MGENPELIAMARRICANACGIGKIGRACAADFLSGRADDGTDMAIALAAIIETTELAAKWADHRVGIGLTNLARDYREAAHLKGHNHE